MRRQKRHEPLSSVGVRPQRQRARHKMPTGLVKAHGRHTRLVRTLPLEQADPALIAKARKVHHASPVSPRHPGVIKQEVRQTAPHLSQQK